MQHTYWLRGTCLAAAVLVTACNGGRPDGPAASEGEASRGFSVEVIRTEMGVPHIFADNFKNYGYGYGYVHAEDNLCVLAEDLTTIRGERAKFFGRDGSYTIRANGSTVGNVDSDFFWKHVATPEAIAPIAENADQEAVDATEGFVAGYNRYVRELRAGQHAGRHASCRDTEWIGPITIDDMYRRYFRLVILASSSVFGEGIATAQPPGLNNLPLPVDLGAIATLEPADFPFAEPLPIGSNMYGIGTEASATGMPMLFGNPHFPWSGTERLYLAHGIIGDTNIMGVGLYGVPAALIGFTDQFAWSHTVSTAYRFSFYELTLNPLDPTQYLYDGEFRTMDASDITVEIQEADGTMSTETRTLYRSHYGPMLEFQVSGVPVLEWSPLKAYTIRDANAENDRLINQFFRWNRAKSLTEFKDLQASTLGVPWVNTVAAGPGQPVYYADVTVVPNVPDSLVTTCQAIPLHQVFQQLVPGLPLLDGSRAACEWLTDDDAPAPGIFGPANLPSLERDDWVHNCNDSYWLTNPAEPLTGFASIIGAEETERSLRTRLCARQIIERLDGSDGLEDTKFTYEQLQDVVLNSRVHSAELALDAVLNSYCALGVLVGTSGPVNIGPACDVLANWDRRNNLDSVGGHIWREFWRNIGLPLPVSLVETRWLTPFDAADAVNTPNTLNVLDPTVVLAFADAVSAVMGSPFELTTPMGEMQRSGVNGDIPVFGGEGFEGSFTIASSGTLSDNGYPVTFGNSYIQAVTWDPQTGDPRAEAFVTYSQSTDPASPYFRDFTEAYSRKEWLRLRYREADVRASPVQVRYQLSE
ncbi:MAG: penicillin acylase family protein [Oceanococcaceae bacterium]